VWENKQDQDKDNNKIKNRGGFISS